MRSPRSDGAAGWILFEAVLLGMIVLAATAVLTVFARTALLAEQSSARMDAAFAARAQLSTVEAELDQGFLPGSAVTEITVNNRIYRIAQTVTHTEEFYDVHLHLSWQIPGGAEQVDFVRRMRRHAAVQHGS